MLHHLLKDLDLGSKMFNQNHTQDPNQIGHRAGNKNYMNDTCLTSFCG